jgi:chromosome segregation ATPase
MNTEQIMAAVERYRTAGGREEHHAYKDQLEAAIEALVQERDALKNQLEEANSGWYDKLLEATLERDALKDTLQDVRGHYERVCKERDALAADAARYRWAKENISDDYALGYGNPCYLLSDDSSGWDATIDAAMKGEAK